MTNHTGIDIYRVTKMCLRPPDCEQIEPAETKFRRRDSVSMEQIQDSGFLQE